MQSHATATPQVFNYSLDWRFLLPLTDLQRGRLLFNDDIDFTLALQQGGIESTQQLSLSEFRNLKNDRFPFFVLPFGLPVSWGGRSSDERVEIFSSLLHFLDAGGYLLVGFNKARFWHTNSQKIYHSSTPRRMAAEIRQSGFRSVKIFGAMPNLQIPEYIFDLDPRTIQFALRNRFRRKPTVLWAVRVMSATLGMQRLSNFLPCYFALATS